MKLAAKIIIIFLVLTAAFSSYGQEAASINATSMRLDETPDGMIVVLEGPVQITLDGSTLSADSATVKLGENLTSLEEAVQSIELTGNVIFTGADGESGSAGAATFLGNPKSVNLRGGVQFSRDGLTASASTVNYLIDSRDMSFPEHCLISDGVITAEADSAEYSLNSRTGSLSGNVEVTYLYGKPLIGDEIVNEVVLTADALAISVDDGEIRTPPGPAAGRTLIVAGNYTMEADSIAFRASDSDVTDVDAQGDVSLTGPEMQYFRSDSLVLSTEEGIMRAEGNVSFSIMGQEGRSDSIEVNFLTGWSIRLTGGSVGGGIGSGRNIGTGQ